jgi:non-specific serine/threonine protein kinase
MVLALLGDAARRQGQKQHAQTLYEEGLELATRLNAGRQIAACQDGLASLAAMPLAQRERPATGSDRNIGALDPLTAREREVSVLIAQGLTNRDIADVLGVSERTVHSHVRSILSRLAVRSRAQIAALASRERQPA